MITGSKGKGGSNPVDQDATLRTQSTIKQLHLISAGEIKGPPYRNVSGSRDPYLSTYFNDTPVRYNNNGIVANNFGAAIAIDYRTGSLDQSQISGFEDVGQITSVGSTIVHGSATALPNPITRTCSLNFTSSSHCKLFMSCSPKLIEIVWTLFSERTISIAL